MYDEVFGGNYKPMTRKKLDQMYDNNEIDHNHYIKALKEYGLYGVVMPVTPKDSADKSNYADSVRHGSAPVK